MNRHLILVRHSTPEVREDRPACDWELSEEGRRRARQLAEQLILYQPEIIITSPEPKAKETAEILAGRFQLPVQVNDDLHEHRRSSVPFLAQSEFNAAVREFFEKPDNLVYGDETADQAHERFSRAVYSSLSQNDNSKIAIVAHGTVISLFVSRLTGQAGFEIWSELGLPGFVILDMRSNDLAAIENLF